MRKYLLFCLAFLLVFGSRSSVCLAEGSSGEIRITAKADSGQKVMQGAQFTIYRVADVHPIDGQMYYVYNAEFEDCNVQVEKLGKPAAAKELLGYVKSQSVAGTSQTTDRDGKAGFTGLADGLYLVAQTNDVAGFSRTDPFFVSVPFLDESGNLNYRVDASPKIGVSYTPPVTGGSTASSTPTDSGTLTDGNQILNITVKKVWNDNGANRPGNVSVFLKKGGEVIASATLSAENNWSHVWTIKGSLSGLSVEEAVPSGYTATYRQEKEVFTVENTPVLVKTGQLKWPVPLLIAMGVLLILVGIRLRRNVNET